MQKSEESSADKDMPPHDKISHPGNTMNDPLGALASAAMAAEASEVSCSEDTSKEVNTSEDKKGKNSGSEKEEGKAKTTKESSKKNRSPNVPPTISFPRLTH